MKRKFKKIIVLPAYLIYLFVELVVGIGIQRDIWKVLTDWSRKN